MSTPIIRANTVIGIEAEDTEGTYKAPSANTSYIQPMQDGFEFKPAREVIERGLLTSAPGKETPRLGIKSVTATLPVEYRASGTEGVSPDFAPLLKAALGAKRNYSSQTTSTTGHTATKINLSDGDASNYSVGDMVVVMESGAYEMRPISEVDTTAGSNSITFPFALTNGAPSDNVKIAKFRTFYTADSGHPTLSLSYYWGDEVRQAAVGCRVSSMSLENYSVGQVASLKFGLDGLTYEDEADGAAPHTPSFDSGVPPIMLQSCIWRAGTSIEVNALTLSLTNTIGFQTSLCSANGRIGSRIVSREITGTINPYKDDASTTYFDNWNDGTEFSLFTYAYNPSSTDGEFELGSCVGIWLPQCFTTEFQTGDLDGLVVDQLTFKATRGSSGSDEEMYLGIV